MFSLMFESFCFFVCTVSISFLLLLTLFMLCLFFFFCFACAAVFASVSIFSQLCSRSQTGEGDEQLGEVREEEELGESGRGASKEVRLQEESKELVGKAYRDKEHQEDLVEKEEDLHQRSNSETNLR